jgi:hypothetical protein
MDSVLLQAHSGWRYLVIIVGVVALIKLLAGLFGGSRWGKLDQQVSLAFLVVMDIQLLLGLVLWIAKQGWSMLGPLRGWEHPMTMILAVAATHITYNRLKRASDGDKYRLAVVGFGIAGVLLALGIWRITGAGF